MRIQILLGSTPKAIAEVEDILAARANGDGRSHVLRVLFDHKPQGPADLAPTAADPRSQGEQQFVQALKPTDAASLRKAQEQGLVVMPSEGWGPSSRGAADNEGAGGVPREGFELAATNADKLTKSLNHAFQQVIAYEKRTREISKGNDLGGDIGRVTVLICASMVGGTGSGSLIWLITECVTADHVRLYGNINARGNMTSLKAFVSHQGHLQHLIWNTPAGGDLQEREPDMVVRERGELEDPVCVYTASTAAIHFNRGRLLDCGGLLAAGMLLQSLLTEGNGERVLADAMSLATACRLIESEEQSQLTATVSRPEELANETVYARAEQSLTDRISGTRGHRRATALSETIQGILNDISPVYEPLMKAKARGVTQAFEEALAARLEQILRKHQGLWEAAHLLQLLSLLLERSQQAISEKASQLQEYLAAQEQMLAEMDEQLQRHSERRWLRRAVNFRQLGMISGMLAEAGKAAINYRLQVAACTIAIQDVLGPLSDLLQRKLARLVSVRQRLAELAQHCRNKAQSRANEPNVFEVPVGPELATTEYIGSWFHGQIARSGGQEGFVESLRGQFLQKYGSLAALADASFQEMEDLFVALCRAVFEPAVAKTNVLAEFARIYPDEQDRLQVIAELIGQSEGRLLVRGEVNKTVAWTKTANVPSAEDTEWVTKLLESADRKAGKWQVTLHSADPETFIAQRRGELSLTPFINELNLPDTHETWKRVIPAAADPVGVTIVGPDPSPRQLKRVLAKAIASDLLTVEDKGGFALRSSLGEACPLGKDAAAVNEKLRPRWGQIVFTESFFASELVDREDEIIARLEQMKADLTAKEAPSDKRLHLIDVAAIDECLQRIELLRPWARKMQKARRRGSV
jgi:hypothetical protein